MSTIDIPGVKAGFRHKHSELGTLVIPRYSKWSWQSDERRFRSAIVKDGKIISSGFVKFGGLEEAGFIGDAEKLKKELQQTGQLRLVEKMDGVLAIRSVIDNKVVWRTRGTFDGGVHRPFIDNLAPSTLDDPSFFPDSSLLFELLHPDWQIVINYNNPQLIFIGGINHADSEHFDWQTCSSIAKANNFAQPKTEIWTGSWKGLIKNVANRVGTEGVVAQSDDGQTLLKIKTAAYCSLHRIRFIHQGQLLVELWEKSSWQTEEQAFDWLKAHGIEIEQIMGLKERISALCKTGETSQQKVLELDAQILKMQMQGISQKLQLKQHLVEEDNHVIDLLLDGRENEAIHKKQKQLVENLLIEWDKQDDFQETVV